MNAILIGRRFLFGAILLGLVGEAAEGAVYTVFNTDDSGPGSLRQCIIDANTNRGLDEIHFDPPDGLFPYFVISNRLPTITDSVIIDGTTSPFWFYSPVVVLDGMWAFNAGNGLQIFASNCWIKALNIQRFPGAGIQIIGGESNVIHRCKIGVDNAWAYNGDGIQIFDANYNTVGGPGAIERNWISGNMGFNIWLRGRSSGNRIEGNVIGAGKNGNDAAPFQGHGINVEPAASTNQILRNNIGGHPGVGMAISGKGTVIQGNHIGFDYYGSGVLPNGQGCLVGNLAAGTVFGGVEPGSANVIAHNTGYGIGIRGVCTNVAILGNAIYDNGGPGIDLGENGPSPNDADDRDVGANRLQNYPMIFSASGDGQISGVLTSTPNANFRIELFDNPVCDPSGSGEGQWFVTAFDVVTGPDGRASFSRAVTFATPPESTPAQRYVTATATDAAGNTSEFSPCTPIANAAPRFVKGPNLVVDEDSWYSHIYGWASDISPGGAGEAWQVITFVVTNDNPALFELQPIVNELGTLSFRPANNAYGTATVIVTLIDDGGVANGGSDHSPSETAMIAVQPINDAPVARPFDIDVFQGMPLELQLTGSDVEGDLLTFRTTTPSHGILSGTPPAIIYKPGPNFVGLDSFTYTVHDGLIESTPATVSIRVLPVNHVPVATIQVHAAAIIASNEVEVILVAANATNVAVVLDATASLDADNDTLQAAWFEDNLAVPFAVGLVAEVSIDVGSHPVTLIVSDGQAQSSAQLFLTVVSPSDAVEVLILQVDNSALPRTRKRPLIATLKAAAAAFDRKQIHVGLNMLKAYQQKVEAQLAPTFPQVAGELIDAAGKVIAALSVP